MATASTATTESARESINDDTKMSTNPQQPCGDWRGSGPVEEARDDKKDSGPVEEAHGERSDSSPVEEARGDRSESSPVEEAGDAGRSVSRESPEGLLSDPHSSIHEIVDLVKPDGMSKNQWKKLQKQRRKELNFSQWKERMRQKDKERRATKRKLLEQKHCPPPPKKKKMSDEDASPVRVAIDLGFDHLMIDKDIKKLVAQCLRCYSTNRKAEKPLQLYITSFNGESKKELENTMQGYQHWDVHFRPQSFMDVFDKESIVFLAAESDNVLTELDCNKVYIIGGLVDHNHHKGYCYKMAVERGLAHAQLPISDYVQLNSRRVLTINHVFEIMLAFVCTGNWKEAFYSVIPKRKVMEKKEASELHPKQHTPDMQSKNVDLSK